MTEQNSWVRTLSTNTENRVGVIEHITRYMEDLPVTEAYTVTIEAEEESRRKAQNDLMWAWNAEAAKAQGTNADYQHGEWKLSILLPMQKGWKRTARRAQRVQELLDDLPSYQLRVFAAYDMVRSKDLGVRHFAEALTAYQQFYAQQGIILMSRQDLIAEALMQQQEAA